MQEMIEDKVFYLYRTDFCAAAMEALDGAVTVTESGGLAGGVFSRKHLALLLAGVDPKETMPIDLPKGCAQDGHSEHQHPCMGDSEQEQEESGLKGCSRRF